MENSASRHLYIWAIASLIAIVAVVFFATPLYDRPFYTRGEGREALVVRSMYDQNNFVLPRRGGIAIPSKPPMFHWMGVLTSEVMGKVDEFSIRFPSAFCGALTLAAFFVFVAYSSGISTAILSTLVGATALEFFRNTTHARVDMCFTFWITVGTLFLGVCVRDWANRFQPRALFYILAGVFNAGAILAKGPAGLGFPWLIAALCVLVLAKGNIMEIFRSCPWRYIIGSFLVSVFLSGTWYLAAYVEGGSEFLQIQLVKENIGRLVDVQSEDVGHAGHFYEPLLFLLGGFMPWAVLLPIVVVWLWSKRKQIAEPLEFDLLFSLVWVVLYIALVCVSKSKREVYLLPTYLPLSFLTVKSLAGMWSSEVSGRTADLIRRYSVGVFSLLGLLIFVCFALVFTVTFGGVSISSLVTLKPAVQLQLNGVLAMFSSSPVAGWLLLIASMLALVSAVCIAQGQIKQVVYNGSLMAIICYFVTNYMVLPVVFDVNSPREFVLSAKETIAENASVFEYRNNFYAAAYYLDKRIDVFQSKESLPPQSESYVLVAENDLTDLLREIPRAKVVAISETNAANGKTRLCLVRSNERSSKRNDDPFI